jgi:hypothetical protein
MKNGFMLKNSFDSIVMRHNLMRNEDEETIEQCVSVADNYAKKFAEYIERYEYLPNKGWFIGSFQLEMGIFRTTQELLDEFKKLKY